LIWLASASIGWEKRICVSRSLLRLALDPAGDALLLCEMALVSLRGVVVFCHNYARGEVADGGEERKDGRVKTFYIAVRREPVARVGDGSVDDDEQEAKL